jgi:hypothetical protein
MTLIETRDRIGTGILAWKRHLPVPDARSQGLASVVTGTLNEGIGESREDYSNRVSCTRIYGPETNWTYIFALYSVASAIVLLFANRETRTAFSRHLLNRA